MPKPLAPLTIAAPGFMGLNTQQSGSILPPGWATKLSNFIYDDVGRIASRKGSQRSTYNAFIEGATNLITNGKDFSHADWTNNGALVTVNTSVNPIDGATDVDTVEDNSASVNEYVSQGQTVVGTDRMSASCWVKKDAVAATTRYPLIRVRLHGGALTEANKFYFDTSDGTVGTISTYGTTDFSASVTEAISGWWLVQFEWVPNASDNTTAELRLFPAVGSDVAGTWTDAVTSQGSIEVWDARIYKAETASPVRSIHEYIDASGNTAVIYAANNKILKLDGLISEDISGTITTPTADNWQFVNFNGWCVGFQEGHAPIVLTSTAGTFADSGGTQYNGTAGLSAYGRLWTVLNSTLYYSDLLINNFTGGSSGTFDLSKFWPNGMDQGVAVADFNGFLVVFGKDSILVYENADDISNMAIVEGINGIGCIARDSVQGIGQDLVFLSASGLRSLGRTLKDESLPLTDLSQHNRDSLVADALGETSVQISSVYNEEDGFYLLSMPTAGKSYCFDLKFPNENGTWKTTTWDIAPTALSYTQGQVMHMAETDGYISKYFGYRDSDNTSGAGGASYAIDYEGVWNDFGQEVANFLKILKSVSILGSGTASAGVTFKWAVDYSPVFHTRALAFSSSPPATYGSAQYSVDTFNAVADFERVRSTLSNTGQVMIYGITATIDGSAFALQRMDILAKIGRLAL